MKALLWGILVIVLVGIGGLIYRNAVSRPIIPGRACTLEAKICPDGTAVGRVAPSCDFAACPPPNVAIAGVVFALPAGYAPTTTPDASALAAYALGSAASPAESGGASSSEIVVRAFALGSSSPESVIYATAISGTSGAPVSPSSITAVTLGNRTYSFAVIERFEGVVDGAFYLPVAGQVLRFDAIDQGVAGWTDSRLDITSLPAESALRAMLSTLQANQ